MKWLRGMFDRGSFRAAGIEANPEALEALVKASMAYTITASQDIVDQRGRTLWSKGQRISTALRERLLERSLQRPLEACLQVEDGVTLGSLHADLKSYLEQDTALAKSLRPWVPELLTHVRSLSLHPVAQLLLTTALATRPQTHPHAVQAMALAGAMAQRQGSSVDTQMAMLGGLLHDIGEVYVHPHHLDHDGPLDVNGHRYMVVHPRLAQLLLSTTTDYPEALCRGVGEHHGRLDGSGYPARLGEDNISELGRMLSVVEVTLGIMRKPDAQLAQASFAMKLVPGEFDPELTSLLEEFARNAKEPVPPVRTVSRPDSGLEQCFERAQYLDSALIAQDRNGLVLEIVRQALERINHLRTTWSNSGFGALDTAIIGAQEQYELEMACAEFRKHVRHLQRECMLLAERLAVGERIQIEPLWRGLLDKSTH
jgi:HD-GYP domain-containing protein (c-di-GMP phosphodiesterase class II)